MIHTPPRGAQGPPVPALLARARREDAGAATTIVLVGGMVLVLAMLFMFVLPVTRGADQASRSQTAADSAALAGAEAIREDVLARLAVGDLGILAGPWASRGGAAATSYASRNDADLVAYTYDAWADEVRVQVRFDEPGVAGTQRVERTAVARVGLALGRCTRTTEEVEPEPTPTPTPTPTEDDDDDPDPTPTPPTPPPPPTYEHGLECPGGLSLSGYEDLDDLAAAALGWLTGRLEPRLVR